MNNEHDEQTRWLITYLETRFSRIEDRIDSVAENLEDRISSVAAGLDNRVRDSLDNIDNDYASLANRIDTVESLQLKLSSQAGFLKNILAFVGTAVLSLVGWIASYWFSSGPK